MLASDPRSHVQADFNAPRVIEYPCSQSQLRFWIEEQLSPQNPALNVAVRWRLEGELAHDVLEGAWQRLVHRHEPLRTALVAVDDQPRQRVVAHIPFAIPIIDLRDLAASERDAEAERRAQIEARTPFDIARAPLIRVTRVILSAQTSILLVTAHHTICDGWSMGILAREMGQICAALSAGVAPFLTEFGLRFGEFAQWELDQMATGSLEAERAYMREMLRGYKQFELLPDFPRPRRLTSNGAIASVLLDRGLTDALATLARANGCTLFMTALAALFTLFHRYSGETDIVLGTQVVGRDDEELEGLVGCFINTIALRADLSGDPTFRSLLEQTRDMVSDTFDVRALPLQQLVEIANPARDPSRNALFSTNFIFQRSFIANETYGPFALIDLPSRSAGALYDLNVFMVERPEGWRVSCEFNTDLFAPATVDGLLERFGVLLRAVVADPDRSIGTIDIRTPADRLALAAALDATRAAYPAHTTLPELVREQAARTPDAVAVVCGEARLTFAEFDAAVDELAGEIRARGCRPGTRIGVLLERSTDLVVALLAVLRAGCAYVPLDPKFPPARLAFIAADAELGATLTRAGLAQRLQLELTNPILVSVGTRAAAPDGEADRARPPVIAGPGDVAYVIYTSGSTGNPKGVEIEHRALTNFLWSMRERPGLTARDTLVAVTTVSFDIAGLELFLPLITGATLVLATETDVVDGGALLALARRSGATIMQATPVTWQLLIDAGWTGDPALRMLCGGEALSRPLAEALLARGDELWNMYGPTETTIWSAVGRVARGAGPVLIAPPIANTQFYVLDPAGNVTPPGVPGELCIGGDGVARGYFKRPELTRERFIADPFSSRAGARLYRTGDVVRTRGDQLEFLGRTDHQVKLRGFRIELDEIGAVLCGQPGVGEAVAIAVDDRAGSSAIRAFVAPTPGEVVDTDRWPALLRARIAEFLPNYMLPSSIVVVDALPRTPNGKIDRAALPVDTPRATAGVRELPASERESQVAGLVATLLGHEHVNRTDDIFMLGFHSLLAVRLVAQIARSTGAALPLRTVFDQPTVAGIAQAIDTALATDGAPAADVSPVTRYNEHGHRTPFVFFHNDALGEGLFCRRLATALGPDRPLIALAPHGSAGLPVLTTIESMAADHLRRIRELQPTGPYLIGGFCAGGLVAYEIARRLRSEGETIENVVLVNASAPPRRSVLFGDALLRRVGLDPRIAPGPRAALCWTLVRLFDSIGSGPRATLRFLAGRLSAVGRRLTGAPIARLNEPEPVNPDPSESETRSYFANLIAAYTYHPDRYEGDIIFMWGDQQPPTPGGPTTGWDRVAPAMRVVSIPGRHLSPVKDGVENLGRQIVAELHPTSVGVVQ
jgi:amino acid adenylation domain-containing protein